MNMDHVVALALLTLAVLSVGFIAGQHYERMERGE